MATDTWLDGTANWNTPGDWSVFVHRQLQLAHDLAQALQGRFGFAPSAQDHESSSGGEFRPSALTGRVGDWRAGLGRSLCSLLTRSFVCECHTISTVPRFQPPP